jgi:hypothetical protein
MQIKNSLLFIFLLLIVFSCKNKRIIEARQIVSKFTGKEILIPNDIRCTVMGKDTTAYECENLMNTQYKILLYVDSLECSSCRLKLSLWKTLILESDSLFHGNLSFMFFFQPKNKREFYFLLRKEQFYYPIFLDMENNINRLNHFPTQPEYQCFLLDKANKVQMIGNPTLSPKIWALYKQVITGKVSDKPLVTTIEHEQTEIELSDLHINKTSEAIFTLKNTGTNPLVIQIVNASCGCTVPEWEKQPVAVGSSTEIKVKITPETSGYFNKTVTVHCNTEEGQISLKVKGMVE